MLLANNYLLIIANSARYLTTLAIANGFKALVIDCYGDCDTKTQAFAYQHVNSLAIEHLSPAITYFRQRYSVKQCIYGSGFENFTPSLYYLASQFILFGNSPDTFKKVQDKRYFFSLLTRLQISHPKTQFTAPDNSYNWLIKPLINYGGVGISYCQHSQAISNSYWQVMQTGAAYSLLFLSDGQIITVIGFNHQWTINLGCEQAFIFAGIINSTDLSDKHKNTVINWLEKLAAELALTGLNSVDFICDGNNCYLLEINPRLSASVQLYSASLFMAHCTNNLSYYQASPLIKGYQIVYAPRDLIIKANVNWASYCVDIPAAGTRCRKGQPICSIIASGTQSHAVLQQLQQQQQFIFSQLLEV
jgi:methenyltetrahydromethanopterin cyclohydrolase